MQSAPEVSSGSSRLELLASCVRSGSAHGLSLPSLIEQERMRARLSSISPYKQMHSAVGSVRSGCWLEVALTADASMLELNSKAL